MEHDKTSSKKPEKTKKNYPSLNHLTTIKTSFFVSNKKENTLLVQMAIQMTFLCNHASLQP